MTADCAVRPLDPIYKSEGPKLVDLLPRDPRVQCHHLAEHGARSEFLRQWRQKREWRDWNLPTDNFDPQNCAFQALYTVAGLPVCGRHAGLILLDACLELSI